MPIHTCRRASTCPYIHADALKLQAVILQTLPQSTWQSTWQSTTDKAQLQLKLVKIIANDDKIELSSAQSRSEVSYVIYGRRGVVLIQKEVKQSAA